MDSLLYPDNPQDLQRYMSITTSFNSEMVKYLLFLVVLIIAGLLSNVFMIKDWRQRRWGSIPPAFALVAGVALLSIALLLLNSFVAYYFGFENVFPEQVGMLLESNTPEAQFFQVICITAGIGLILGFTITVIAVIALFKNGLSSRRESAAMRKAHT